MYIITNEYNFITGIMDGDCAPCGIEYNGEVPIDIWNHIGQYKFINNKFIKIQEKEEMTKLEEQNIILKKKLSDTDYIVIKIAEGVATSQEYQDIINQRSEWRKTINDNEQKIQEYQNLI